MSRKNYTRFIVTTAMFAAVSAVLMILELPFPLPLMPPFLKLDLSDIPVLIGAFVLGPLPAVLITLVKDLIHLTVTQTAGVGELADFLVTAALALAAGYVFRVKKSLPAAVAGCAAGIAAMTVIGAISNLYILLPFYAKMMPLDAIFALCSKANPVITDSRSYILFGIVPFNIIKGLLVSAVTIPVYRRLTAILFKRTAG